MALKDRLKNKSAQEVLAELKSKVDTGIGAFATMLRPTTEIGHTLAVEPMPHQLVIGEAVQAGHKRLLIADDMGVGKTYSALLALETAGAYPALIVCPPALAINWKRSVQTALPHRSVATIGGKTPGAVPTTDIVIVPDSVVGYWALPAPKVKQAWEAENRQRKPKDRTPAPQGVLVTHSWRALVQDECHRSKNPDASRTKGVTALAKSLDADALVLMLSGTPMTNRPVELVPILNILGHLPRFGGAGQFKARYCAGTVTRFGVAWDGANHLDELHDLLRRWVMIRRKRDEVLTLPNHGRSQTVVGIPADSVRKYKKAEADLVDFLREKTGNDELSLSDRAQAIVLLGQLRQIVGLGKVKPAVDMATDLLDSGEQVFLATMHKQVAWELRSALIASGLKPHEVVSITGDDSAVAKQRAVDAFQSGTARVVIGNIIASGEGLTMTSGRHMIVVELPWTPASLKQVEARLHRYGQTREVISNVLISDIDEKTVSVDERIWGALQKKAEVIGSALDGEAESLSEGTVQDMVLGSYA